MVGLLSGKLFLVGKEENVIKAKNEHENDSKWFKLTFGNGAVTFSVTCGDSWKCQVAPDKEVVFDSTNLVLFKEYDVTFDVDASSGYNKLKLRTFKMVQSSNVVSK